MSDLFDLILDFVFARESLGAETTRSHSWPWPPSVTIVLLAGAAVYIAWIYARERGNAGRLVKVLLATIRIGLVGLLVFMMYGWMLHRHRTDLPDIVVLIDDSESMGLVDHYDDQQIRAALAARLQEVGPAELTRFNLARLLMLENDGDFWKQLDRRYRLKVYRMGASARLLTQPESAATDGGVELPTDVALRAAEPIEPSSRLGKCLRDVLQAQRGRPTAAVILLTDGVTTEGQTLGEVSPYARRKAVPLFIVGVGNDRAPRDVRLSDLLVDEVAFVDDLVNFDFKVTGSGYEDQSVKVRLRAKGGGSPLAEQTVKIKADGLPESVRLSHRPQETGDFEYTVEAETLDGEVNLQNNAQTKTVKVRDETLRVLYVQETPSYEFRFLKNALGRGLKREGKGQAIELTTVLQEADLEYAEQDETAERVFPVTQEELFAYDVLIFGDVNPSFLSRGVQDNIVAFVEERGGGIVFLAGPRHTPLAYRDSPIERLFPVDIDTSTAPALNAVLTQAFTIQPTRLGISTAPMQLKASLAESMSVWRELPGVYWLLESPDLRPGTRVLADVPGRFVAGGENLPVITMKFAGAGITVFHGTDESYRWSRHPEGEVYFDRYWTQLIRYLSRSRLLAGSREAELTTDRDEYQRGEPVRLRVRFFNDRLAPAQDDGVTVIVERDAGRRQQVTLSRDDASRGLFEGAASDLADGEYRVWMASPTLEGQPPSQRFSVVAPPGELARLQMEAADLRLAAKESQGKFYTLDTAAGLLEDLPRGRQVRIESLPPKPVWNSSMLAGLFVVLIASEWLLRKRVGLL